MQLQSGAVLVPIALFMRASARRNAQLADKDGILPRVNNRPHQPPRELRLLNATIRQAKSFPQPAGSC